MRYNAMVIMSACLYLQGKSAYTFLRVWQKRKVACPKAATAKHG
jgi:hypothetical protein